MRSRAGWFRTASVASVLVIGISACGGGGTPSDEPKKGGTMRVGLVTPTTIDPALASTVSERVMADMLHDGLTTWDATDLHAVPALAERWVASTDQRHWTFRLRKDIFAANGDAITAADVKASLQRIAAPRSSSPVRELLSIVTGYEPYSKEQAAELSGVVAVDNTTLRIDLNVPNADLPRLLGSPNFGIVHPIAGGDYMTTGPFAVIERAGDLLMTLRRSEKSAALLDQVDVKFYKDVTTAYNSRETDKLDWLPVPSEKVTELADKRLAGTMTAISKLSLRALYLSFNLQDPRYADQRFREAIIHAIDRDSIARSVAGSSPPLDGIVVHAVPGSLEDSCGRTCDYNPSASKSLIRDVFGDGAPPTVTIDIASGPPFTNEAVNQIVRELSAVGISAVIRPTATNAFGAVTVQPDRQVFQTSWSAAYPSAEAFLAPLFQSASPANVSGLRDAKIDEGILAAQSESNTAERAAQWQNVERRVMGTVPVIPIGQFPIHSAVRNQVKGLAVLPTGNFDITPVWLD